MLSLEKKFRLRSFAAVALEASTASSEMEVDKIEADEVFDNAEKCACFGGTVGFSLTGLAATEERSWLLYGGSGVIRFGRTSGRPPTAPNNN